MDRKLTFVLYGIGLWLLGVVLIRILGPVLTGSLGGHIGFLLLMIVAAPATLIPIAKLTGRTKHDMLVPSAIMAMPAMLMDGLATTFDARGLTHIYFDTPVMSAYAGGGLLVAFWAIFFFALLWHRA